MALHHSEGLEMTNLVSICIGYYQSSTVEIALYCSLLPSLMSGATLPRQTLPWSFSIYSLIIQLLGWKMGTFHMEMTKRGEGTENRLGCRITTPKVLHIFLKGSWNIFLIVIKFKIPHFGRNAQLHKHGTGSTWVRTGLQEGGWGDHNR